MIGRLNIRAKSLIPANRFLCHSFSIWHVGPQGDAEVVGHSAHTMNSRQNGNGYAMNALFLSAETIFSTDTFGNVATYTSDVR
jgi:hypothetical protein